MKKPRSLIVEDEFLVARELAAVITDVNSRTSCPPTRVSKLLAGDRLRGRSMLPSRIVSRRPVRDEYAQV